MDGLYQPNRFNGYRLQGGTLLEQAGALIRLGVPSRQHSRDHTFIRTATGSGVVICDAVLFGCDFRRLDWPCGLKIKPSRSFEKSENAHLATRLHVQEELNSQQHRCENLKTCNTLFHVHALFLSSCLTATLYSPPVTAVPLHCTQLFTQQSSHNTVITQRRFRSAEYKTFI